MRNFIIKNRFVHGRKSYECLGEELQKNMNVLHIVISNNKEYKTEYAIVVHDFEDIFKYTKDCEYIFLSGGIIFK
jgi:dihydrofolate reductase